MLCAQVDFDKTKHLSERMIRKRRLERERLQALEDLRVQEERQEQGGEERMLPGHTQQVVSNL